MADHAKGSPVIRAAEDWARPITTEDVDLCTLCVVLTTELDDYGPHAFAARIADYNLHGDWPPEMLVFAANVCLRARAVWDVEFDIEATFAVIVADIASAIAEVRDA